MRPRRRITARADDGPYTQTPARTGRRGGRRHAAGLRAWIAPATARWVLLALLGWYWVRFIVLPVDVIKRTKVLNAFAVTWWVNSFPILPAVTGAVLLWYGAPFERRVWGSLLLFIVVSALAGYLTIIRYNHKLKKSQQ